MCDTDFFKKVKDFLMYSICMHNYFMLVCQLYCQMYTKEINDVYSKRPKLLIAFLDKCDIVLQ